jgi:hypothetical protein
MALYFLSPSSEVSIEVCHVPEGQKLKEEINFEGTGHFQPYAVPWRLGDLRHPPCPKITCKELDRS